MLVRGFDRGSLSNIVRVRLRGIVPDADWGLRPSFVGMRGALDATRCELESLGAMSKDAGWGLLPSFVLRLKDIDGTRREGTSGALSTDSPRCKKLLGFI